MATATIDATLRPTVIDNAEATTNWGGDSFATNANFKIQGNSSVECAMTATGNNDAYVSGSWDVTNTHIRLWFNITFIGYLAASNAIQIWIQDTGANTDFFYVDKWADYNGGWMQAVIYTGDTPDVDGSADHTIIDTIGIRFVTSTKPRNVPANAWFDAWTFGEGYTVTGGVNSDPIDWEAIAVADATDAFGIVTNVDGVYFVKGEVTIGDGDTATYFAPTGQLVVFPEEQVNSTLYAIIFDDNSNGNTDVDISGGAWTSSATSLRFTITASDTAINSFSIDGVQISKAAKSYFHAGANIQNCVFDDCYQIDPSTATFKYNTIKNYLDDQPSSAAAEAALLWPTNDSNCTDNEFSDCTMCVEYNASSDSTPIFNNMLFDDNSGWFDVLNTSGNSATEISLIGTSNANSYTGDYTTFSASYTHTLTSLINNSEVTYVARGAADDTGADGSTTTNSRNFVTTNSWVVNEHQGKLLKITSGADEGRYYVSGNSATTLYLDAEMTATAGTLTWELYDENDDTEEYHVENVTGNQTEYVYAYQAGYYVDIIIIHQDYEQVVYEDIHLSNSSESIPVPQVLDVNYYNP